MAFHIRQCFIIYNINNRRLIEVGKNSEVLVSKPKIMDKLLIELHFKS